MKCLACDIEVISSKQCLCHECWSEIVFLPKNHEKICSLVEYNTVIRKLIHIFKYSSPWKLSGLFVDWISLMYGDFLEEIDVILPVPMHKYKLMSRSYNQVAVLCRKIAKKYNKKCFVNVLTKIKNTHSQSLLDRDLRLTNVIDSFHIKKPQLLDCKKVLVIDDVITTGTTMTECIKTIQNLSNPNDVMGLCIASTKI
jgi:ComF family protein